MLQAVIANRSAYKLNVHLEGSSSDGSRMTRAGGAPRRWAAICQRTQAQVNRLLKAIDWKSADKSMRWRFPGGRHFFREG